MSGWQRWRRLAAEERAETRRAAVLITVFVIAIRIVSLPRLLARISTRRTGTPEKTGDGGIALSVRSLERASVHAPLGGTCLARSLTLMYLLARRGVATELRIGTRRHDGRLTAHAWVEKDGVALNDAAGLRHDYAVLPEKQTAA